MSTHLPRIGIALLLTAAMISPATAQGVPPRPDESATVAAASLDASARKAVVESAISQMSANYVYPDRTPAIARTLRQKLASGTLAIGNPKDFADAVNKVIESVANDRHLRLSWSREPLPPLPTGEPDPAIVAQMVAMMAKQNFGFAKVEVLDGNIGYLKMDMLARAQDAGPVLAAAMSFLQHTDALILDLTDNGGGDPEMETLAVSYFVPVGTQINAFHQRDKAVDVQMWALPYVPGGRWSTDRPLYVLTSKDTASGGEAVAYDLQQLKRGTVIGETTWGGANPGDFFPIDQHFLMFVPTGAAVNPVSKTNWEGVGVKPDVPTDRAAALETARRMALRKLLADAKGERAQELQKLLDAQPDH
jgi:retinol-binding protein 3